MYELTYTTKYGEHSFKRFSTIKEAISAIHTWEKRGCSDFNLVLTMRIDISDICHCCNEDA